MQRQPDLTDQASLLEADQLSQEEPVADAIARLPKDVKKYLLRFCAVQEIGRLAQVNTMLHGLINDAAFQNSYEVRSNFSMRVPDMNGDLQMQTQPGYVRGSYAQLRNFFTARDSEEHRLAELEGTRCLNDVEDENPCFGANMCLGIGVGSGTVYAGLAAFLFLRMEAPYKFVALKMMGSTAGLCCLIGMGSAICVCAGKQLVRKKNERNALRLELTGEPGLASLHGAMFSWQPTVVHEERAPAALRMNE
jgi:hypothetical protein